jgi:hypothetical protein
VVTTKQGHPQPLFLPVGLPVAEPPGSSLKGDNRGYASIGSVMVLCIAKSQKTVSVVVQNCSHFRWGASFWDYSAFEKMVILPSRALCEFFAVETPMEIVSGKAISPVLFCRAKFVRPIRRMRRHR